MRMTIKTMGLAATLLTGVVSLALAQGAGVNAFRGAGRGTVEVNEPVSNLTSEQKTKIAALRAAAMEKVAPLRAEVHAKMLEMRELWSVEKPDRKAIVGKQAEMDAIHQKMQAIWTDFGLDVHALLTPAQRAEWAQSIPGRGWGMGPGMAGGGGPRGRRGGGAGRGPGRGMGMGPGMDGCPCGYPMCPMNQP